jgi:hypothetical protein
MTKIREDKGTEQNNRTPKATQRHRQRQEDRQRQEVISGGIVSEGLLPSVLVEPWDEGWGLGLGLLV